MKTNGKDKSNETETGTDTIGLIDLYHAATILSCSLCATVTINTDLHYTKWSQTIFPSSLGLVTK